MNWEAAEEAFLVDEDTFSFGSFSLIPSQRMLLNEGKPLRLGSRALDILVSLVESAGETIRKDDLIARTWPDTVVDDGTLRVHVAALRKALGDGRAGRRYIASNPGRGYTFVAPVTREQAPPANAMLDTTAAASNLPVSLTRIVGRDGIVAGLATQLAERRFLTIVGPGGIGKTTVAVAVAEALNGSYGDGVWFVGLASLQDPALVPGAIIAALGRTPGVGDPLNSLVAWLRDKRTLMIFDNCEHVINAAAVTVEALLKAAPQVAILATSREPLRAEGEWLLRLPSLKVPPEGSGVTAAEALSFPAVELFSERAIAAVGNMGLADADVPAVIEICRHLDGVPLAIELAAAQVDVLGVRGLAARLDDRLAVLTRGRRTALPRQQTLRATIDWSYELLPESERRLLRRLAVFPGGFRVEATTAVVSGSDDRTGAVLDGVANLVAKSLVTSDGSVPSGRWRLLETVRAFALDKLVENGEAEQAARRHAEFFRDLFAPDPAGSRSPLVVNDMAGYVREIDNVRAALDWSFSPGGDPAIGIVLTAAYVPVWLYSALLVECRERTSRALDSLKPDMNLSAGIRMQLQLGLGYTLTFTMGSVEDARRSLAGALEIADSLDDVEAQLQTLWTQWVLHFNIGECCATQSITEQFSLVARRTDDPAVALVADRLMDYTLQHGGEQREAQHCFERVLEHYVAPKDQRHAILLQLDQRVLARAMLARVLWLRGNVDQAIDQGRISLEEAEATDHKLSICEALRLAVCQVPLMTGDLVAAEQAVAKLIDLATRADATLWRLWGSCFKGKLLIARGEFVAGSELLRTTLDTYERIGWAVWYPRVPRRFGGRIGRAWAAQRSARYGRPSARECRPRRRAVLRCRAPSHQG